jgi:CubicO group peptidase (beta-lactamase class C family)
LEGNTVQAGRPVKGEETMRKLVGWAVLMLMLFAGTGRAAAASLPSAKPEEAGMSSRQLAVLDDIVGAAVARKDFPGAVLLVARKGKVVYRRAFGNSQIVPESRPMTADMIFDLASVTKPVATATSIMLLVERGDIRLWDQIGRAHV